MKIIFARHGESQANILREISNRGLKHPLTLAGRQQAAALADRLQAESIWHIYSSPILRAIETSIIIAQKLGIEYEVHDALREYDMGEIEGRADAEAWQLWQELFDSWSKDQCWERKIQGGENFYDVKNRFVPFIAELVKQSQSTSDNVACIGHGGLYWMMLPLVLSNIDRDFLVTHSGLGHTDTVVTEVRNDQLVCIEWKGQVVAIE